MKQNKISYAITVCNEFEEIQRLLEVLLKYKRSQDEVVILFDSKNGDTRIEEYLRTHSVNGEFAWHAAEFENHFADWKNKLTSFCSGTYIYQIDADEVPSEYLMLHLPEILDTNPGVDVYLVPRINTVDGLTQAHIEKWNWNVNDVGWVNFPDYQWRIYRNSDKITWVNKVHERLNGFDVYSALPAMEQYCLSHPKTIARQERQNNYYDTL
jgi:Glycosyl transferase family 2